MKQPLFVVSAALGVAVLFSSCGIFGLSSRNSAGVKVADTQVASGATHPRAIYVRPFNVAATSFTGNHAGGPGERPIRQSLAGREFAKDLKQELEKLAPAMVIEHNEVPEEGWLVEGTLDVVHAGSPGNRVLIPADVAGAGGSAVLIHVRITDAGGNYASSDKDASVIGRKGRVLYEFDLAGGSRTSGHVGTISAPGLGYSVPFDFKNAAERVMLALSVDPFDYGHRASPSIR